MMQENRFQRIIDIVCLISGAFLLLLFYVTTETSNYEFYSYESIKTSRTITYAIIILLTLLVGVVFAVVIKKLFQKGISVLFPWEKDSIIERNVMNPNVSTILYVIGVIIVLYYLYKNQFGVPSAPQSTLTIDSFIRNVIDTRVYFLILFVSSIFVFAVIKRNCEESTVFRIAFIIVLTVISGFYCYVPSMNVSIYHWEAYITPITKYLTLMPIDNYSIGTYGHYGLLYLPFVKLFGESYSSIVLLVAICGMITFLCIFAILNKTIKNDLWFCVCACAVSFGINTLFLMGGRYVQGFPHRVFFPAIAICFLIKDRTAGRINYIISCLIGTISLIWNIESGTIVIIILALYYIIHNNALMSGFKHFCMFLKSFGIILISIVGFYGVLSLYNLSCGGGVLRFVDCLYPLVGRRDYVNRLSQGAPSPNIVNIHMVMILTSIAVIISIICKLILNISICDRDSILFLCSVWLLGIMIYFINRPYWGNVMISVPPAIILFGTVSQNAFIVFNKTTNLIKMGGIEIKHFLSMGLILLTIGFALEAMLYIEPTIEFHYTYMNDKSTQILLEDFIKENVPEGTMSFGLMIPTIYYDMHRDSGIQLVDWTCMNQDNVNELCRKLKDTSSFFACKEYGVEDLKSNYNVDFSEFVVKAECVIEDRGKEFHYAYYVKQ